MSVLAFRSLSRLPWLRQQRRCQLCDEAADHAQRDLCSSCEAELPWLGAHCRICALPLAADGLICGNCQKHPPTFTRVEACWRYAFPVDSLINRFKHQARWPYGRLLAELLAEHLLHAYAENLPRPQALLPVPLARLRQRQRGFNQAQMLADWLGARLQLPAHGNWLQRHQETPAQQGLDAASRKRNLRRAFTLGSTGSLAGSHLALVDDVMTTGATAEALARLLRQAGAARIDLYCLARTPRPGDI
ncbi:ComF family protein [Pseudomonas sp. NCCP-436]|uniref:ComF family protein n=1 Tax=Pseudomonas sp. NCCP-436 TaxID=2842481 RepID=UPI001C7EBD3D|nr:ComF family protein [Pseudomonas sp. NCCP-436]GIZ12647.1 phosphoribosyltransferase [Pseudomonas sp. NCCP-436]